MLVQRAQKIVVKICLKFPVNIFEEADSKQDFRLIIRSPNTLVFCLFTLTRAHIDTHTHTRRQTDRQTEGAPL